MKVDKAILWSPSHVNMMDVGEHIQAEGRSPRSLIVQNFDDESSIKITRKDVEEMTKMIACALTIDSDLYLSPPLEDVPIYGVYVNITETEDD